MNSNNITNRKNQRAATLYAIALIGRAFMAKYRQGKNQTQFDRLAPECTRMMNWCRIKTLITTVLLPLIAIGLAIWVHPHPSKLVGYLRPAVIWGLAVVWALFSYSQWVKFHPGKTVAQVAKDFKRSLRRSKCTGLFRNLESTILDRIQSAKEVRVKIDFELLLDTAETRLYELANIVQKFERDGADHKKKTPRKLFGDLYDLISNGFGLPLYEVGHFFGAKNSRKVVRITVPT